MSYDIAADDFLPGKQQLQLTSNRLSHQYTEYYNNNADDDDDGDDDYDNLIHHKIWTSAVG